MDVFLSYARSTARRYAEAVYRELGGEIAFLDTEEIKYGDRFPQRLVDALLDSRIIVVFADPTYFTRWYGILEFRAALTPFLYLSEKGGATTSERTRALESIIVVLPRREIQQLTLLNLHPELQQQNWTTVDDPVTVAQQVRDRLSLNPPKLAERIDATIGRDQFQREWLEVAPLPGPARVPPEIPFVHPRGLPRSLNERFVGRLNDLWRIHYALTAQQSESQAVAVEGIAGVGKSTLAREYLYRYGPRYYSGGLFWIDAERPLDPQYSKIVRALSPNVTLSATDSEQIADQLIAAFRAIPVDKPNLVIIDNIPEPASGERSKTLEDWFPAAGFTRLLTTSRSRFSITDRAVESLEVGILDDWTAKTLLTREIDSHSLDEAGWRLITNWVGSLPLALELLNRALVAHAFTADELLARAQFEGTTTVLDQAMDALRPVLSPGVLRGASEALILSFDALSDEAKDIARLIGWLAPDPIPEELLDVMGIDRTVRSILVTRSFVTGSTHGSVPVFGSIHRVVGDFLRTKSADNKTEFTTITRALFDLMRTERIRRPSDWPLMETCEPHAVDMLNHIAEQVVPIQFVEHIAMLYSRLIHWYIEQGRTAEAASSADNALFATSVERDEEEIVDSLESGDVATKPKLYILHENPAVQHLLWIVPEAFAANEDYDKAIAIQRTNLSLLQEDFPPNDNRRLIQTDNLANLLRRRGNSEDLEEAYKILVWNLPLWRSQDPFSKNTLTALNNLALVELERGQAEEAIKGFEEVLEVIRNRGDDELDTVQTIRNLASALQEKDPQRWRNLLEEALAIADRIGIEDTHWMKLRTLQDLGHSLHTRGDYAGAQAYLRREVHAVESSLGIFHPETTIAAWALFDTELRSGNNAEATETRLKYLDWLRTAEDDLSDEQQRIKTDVQRRT